MYKQVLKVNLMIGLLICSCRAEQKGNDHEQNESFVNIQSSTIDSLNQIIVSKNLKTPDEILAIYKPKDTEPSSTNYIYSITKKDLNKNTQEFTVIEEGIGDDSVAGEKTIIVFTKENELKIVSIRKNFKCWKDRGHEDWSTELCR